MERRTATSPGDRGAAQPGEHARMSLALWLRQGRATRGMSVEDVAKITKIQSRILERLEAGRFEGLPAEVFVRGFVRSFARCVGLDETEALTRYAACGRGDVAGTTAGVAARAFVETMSELAPAAARAAAGPRILRAELAAAPAPTAPIEVVEAPAEAASSETTSIDVELTELDSPRIAEGSTRLAVMPSLAAGTSESELVVAAVEAAAAELALAEPTVAEPIVAEPTVAEPTVAAKKKRTRKPKVTVEGAAVPATTPRKRKKAVTELAPIVAEAAPVIAEAAPVKAEAAPASVEAEPVESPVVDLFAYSAVDLFAAPVDEAAPAPAPAPAIEVVDAQTSAIEDAETGGLWTPKMPPAQPSVPWRRPTFAAQAAPVAPSITIDDADPDSAERVLEDRREQGTRSLRSFLPPILLDRDDRSGRQGGLTLAVIILLIAATLTLSYLMRRPGSSGDGMTARDVPTQPIA